MRYQLGEPAALAVRLTRGGRGVRKAVFKGRGAGVGTVAVRRVRRGRYVVRVTATDAAGLAATVKRKVVVRR